LFRIVERFLSIQGEGKYAGVPSYFLRTGGCNLRCPGFGCTYQVSGEERKGCDTWYAVDRAFAGEWEAIERPESLLEEWDAMVEKAGYTPHLVITGGEPMIHAADPVFYRIVEELTDRGVSITFESNGTLAPDFESFPAYDRCTFSLSVKLSNSGEPRERRIRPEALEALDRSGAEIFFKFVLDRELIRSGKALEEIGQIAGYIPRAQVYCMPMGEGRPQLREHDEKVFAFCIRHGYRYSDRLHIRIFDTAPGV